MSDITCIYEMNMIEENEQLESDILSGRGMELILCLMDGMANRRQIAERLGMPVYSVQLYLQRLLNAGLVKEKIQYVQNDQIEKYYELASSEIEIMNRIQGNNMDENEKRRKALLSSQHFAIMTRNAIKNVNINPEKPNKIKAYFMKARREDMEEFRKEIDLLFEKYQLKEDLDANDTYSLFTVLAPYEMED
ncbi:MAG: hypothetical protein EGR89_05325 [[Eubacterium] rectale]|nr:hypothetical protein [Agathobacter rectalis]